MAVAADPILLKSIIAQMAEGVVVVDNQGRLIYHNQSAARMLSAAPLDAASLILDNTATGSVVNDFIKELRKQNGPLEREVKIDSEPQKRFFRLNGGILNNRPNQPVFVVVHDITQVKRLEAIRRDFVANVSHELKTPLTSIRGFLETLEDVSVDDQHHRTDFFRRISQNVERLTNLVNDVLELARVESKEDELNLMEVDANEVLERVFGRQSGNFSKHRLEAHLKLHDAPIKVMADSEGLIQIVDNLLDNAIKYTPSPGKIRARTYIDGDFGVVEVKDTGVGIESKFQERIFQRFYRIDKQRSLAVGGTGLGLAIVNHLVSAMNGKISIQSKLGMGSTFQVRIPLVA